MRHGRIVFIFAFCGLQHARVTDKRRFAAFRAPCALLSVRAVYCAIMANTRLKTAAKHHDAILPPCMSRGRCILSFGFIAFLVLFAAK